ncbi:MAG: hypothetical protein WA584_23435 [Pyrinomonadaceae bacterium]
MNKARLRRINLRENGTQQLFFDVEGYSFVVNFTGPENTLIEGKAYPIQYWSQNGTNENRGWSYILSHDGSMCDELNDACRILFKFSFCWRGIWEGRIYFLDDEYWTEELKPMSALWDAIEKHLKKFIKQANPEYDYES